MEQDELLWRQYNLSVELYKYYVDILVKFNVFFYALTGSIVSFFFANSTVPNIKFSLLVPLVLSMVLAALFVFGTTLVRNLQFEVRSMRDSLGLQASPAVGILSPLLYICSIVYALTALGCGFLLGVY